MPCERHRLGPNLDLDLAARVAARLEQGELVALPTESVYGIAAHPGRERAIDAVRAIKGRAAAHPFTWHVADAADLTHLCGASGPRVRRLIERYWPGPLTLVLPDQDGGTKGVRLPAHEFTRAVIRSAGVPLLLTSVNRTGESPLCDADAIEREFGSALAMLIDDGPSPLGSASTVARATGRRFEVLREGILSVHDVLHTAASKILFVCTGNTCRSPMAEAMARAAVAKALAVPLDELLAHGLGFASAGTGTMPGMPASEGSMAAAVEGGFDVSAHQSREVDVGMLHAADRIYGMTRSHVQQVLAVLPDVADKTDRLDPNGRDIADPYGGDLRGYRKAREQIGKAIEARLPEWLQLADG